MGLVLVAFIVLLFIENLAIGLGYRAEFVSAWEMGSARANLSPIALALASPVAISSVLIGRLAAARRASGVGVLGALGGAATAYGVSTGRHLAHPTMRVPFIALAAVLAGAIAWALARELVRLRPRAIAGIGAAIALGSWLADMFVLPRLYPVLHLALFFLTLIGWSATALLFRRWSTATALAAFGIISFACSVAWAPTAAKRVAGEDNLRRVLVEHAPILGRAVVIANRLSPPPPLAADDAATATLTGLRERRQGAPALDWQGRDIVLVTIDALRADHVSSYGYTRPTTPNIDGLAARGARFEHAYCPTPHTSYSVASMMTGKYMKPLLALGADEDASETWPVQLRRYGYRTAAFYPPAVFFIDEHRFRRMRDENLGFEYKKEEFAEPELRRAQIEHYLKAAPRDKPVFLWLHLFEPHEPYEAHPEFPFEGDPRVDAYDSEIAAADALVGDVVRLVGAQRSPGTVFIVSADHGEEHGDHGGRYHGTTVYEEQVRVPLVVVAPGVQPGTVSLPVQTIDLLPTTLAALDVPIPPRLRGRDLGPTLAAPAATRNARNDEGLAFAETDDYTLVARGPDRLVCARKIGSCTLFDIEQDPNEHHPIANRPDRVLELRKLTAAIERETGKVEASGLPEALRRGLLGDRDAAEDVAPLLDDVRVDIRRLAAKCAFTLQAPDMKVQLERAEARDEDADVRRWSALALTRPAVSSTPMPAARLDVVADVLKKGEDADQKYAAALGLAERGDARGERELVARWAESFTPDAKRAGELDAARELLRAFSAIKSRAAVPVLVRSLDDVRLRPFVVEALGAIGDPRAKTPLLRVFEDERYVHLRAPEARTLVALGARQKLIPPLARFAGMPEPMTEAVAIARDAGQLRPDRGGWIAPAGAPPETMSLKLRIAQAGPARLLVLGAGPARPDALLSGEVDGVAVSSVAGDPTNVYVAEIDVARTGDVPVRLALPSGIAAIWLVSRAEEIPPPPPATWDGGVSPDGDNVSP